MPTYTTTYSLGKPVVGADEDAWGDTLNASLDSIDDILDGTTPVTGIDINSGTIDNVVIGGATPAAGTFTTLTANTSITGTLATAAQPNITSVGSLTSLDVAGTLTSDGLDLGATTDGATVSNTASDYQLQLGAAQSTTNNIGRNISFGIAGVTTAAINTIDAGTSNSQHLAFYSGNATAVSERLRISTGGDISFYEDTGTTAKFFWDASAESLGIGTSSPEVLMHLTDNANGAKLRLQGNGGNAADSLLGSLEYFNNDGSDDTPAVVSSINSYSSAANGTGGYLTFATHDGTEGGEGSDPVERMRIDSSGRVGIGTSSPSAKLDVAETDSVTYSSSAVQGDLIISRKNSANTVNQVVGLEFDVTGWSGSTTGVAGISAIQTGANASSAALAFQTRNSGTIAERMRIDSSGNVGIGTSSPTSRLTVASGSDGTGTGDGIHFFGSASNNQAAIQSFNAGSYDGDLRFYTSKHGSASTSIGSERMRIDSDGDLLLGKTTAASTTAGMHLDTNGKITTTRSSGPAAAFVRLTSDGDIVTFQKDGTTVGSIGTAFGATYIGTADTGLYFNGSSDAIIPYNPSGPSSRDNAVDLGLSSTRFRNLYLSGGVYLGGTGSANKLDDYEEGTFTITSENAGVSNPSTVRGKLYTKIGRLVTVSIEFVVPSNSVASQAIFGGLPFASSNLNTYRDVGSAEGHSSATFSYILSNTSNFYIYGADFTAVTYQALSNQTIVINLTYMTS
jgi:hypothetical protein